MSRAPATKQKLAGQQASSTKTGIFNELFGLVPPKSAGNKDRNADSIFFKFDMRRGGQHVRGNLYTEDFKEACARLAILLSSREDFDTGTADGCPVG